MMSAMVAKGASDSLPFDAGVFDGHVLGRVSALHLEGVAGGGAVDGELLVQGGAEEVGQVLVLLPVAGRPGTFSGAGTTRN